MLLFDKYCKQLILRLLVVTIIQNWHENKCSNNLQNQKLITCFVKQYILGYNQTNVLVLDKTKTEVKGKGGSNLKMY